MLRVVEVIHGLGRGGAERTIIDRVQGTTLGIDTVVISTDRHRRQLASDLRASGASLLDLDGVGFGARNLIAAVDELQPDLVLSHSPRSTIQLSSTPPRPSGPVIPVLHNGPASPRTFMEPIVHIALAHANRHCAGGIALSHAAGRGRQSTGLPSVHVVPPRIRPVTISREATGSCTGWPVGTSLRLLFLARMEPEKRPLEVLHAVSRIAEELRLAGAHLVMAGDGSELPAARGLAIRLSVSDLVTFTGEVPSPDSLLDECDLLVIASRYEGGPLTLYEAQSRGARILATDVGAVRETLSGDSHHVVIPASVSVAALASALAAVVANGAPGDVERSERRAASRFRTESEIANRFYCAAAQMAGLGVTR